MRKVKVLIQETLLAEAKLQREGAFEIFHDEHGNRGTRKTKPDPSMADLLEEAAKEIYKLEAAISYIKEDAWRTGLEDGKVSEREVIVEWLRHGDSDVIDIASAIDAGEHLK